MNANLLPLLSVLAIVGIAGCTTPTGGAGPGVVILAWEPELTEVFSNEDVDFLLRIQNQGESRARNVEAEITNIDLNEWGGFFQQNVQLGDMIAADPVTNTPGEVATHQFTDLQAPSLVRGADFTYQPAVRVAYDYTTNARKPITIVDNDELIRIKQQGQSLPSETTQYTAGPLAVQITVGDFVRTSGGFGDFGQTFDIFPVHITITNSQFGSGGTVIPKGFGGFGGFGGERDHPVEIEIIPPPGTNFVHSGFGSDCSTFFNEVDLFKGERAEITCELEVTSPPTIRTESLIQVNLEYRYFVESLSSITVQGTEELGGFGF